MTQAYDHSKFKYGGRKNQGKFNKAKANGGNNKYQPCNNQKNFKNHKNKNAIKCDFCGRNNHEKKNCFFYKRHNQNSNEDEKAAHTAI